MESLGEFMAGGVTVEVIDNGVSTTPESTLSAVKSVQPAGRALLIAGGQAKQGVSLRPLADELAARGDWIMVPFGAAAADLARAAREAGATVDDQPQCESVEDAARRALAIAERDGVRTVLFSPACASFDRYANFQERALAFRRVLPSEGRRHP
jgi:UDP-N-acetylmuramoylalanine--D-glutamate ligase